jgi:putative sigma-54 modulation protein
MDIRIITKNTTLTPALDEYVRSKVANFEKHFPQIFRVEVELEVFKNKHHADDLSRAEIIVHVPKKRLRADERASEMHEAFDLVMPKIEKQLEKHKAKLRRRDRGFLERVGTVFSPLFKESSKRGGDLPDDEGDYEE